MDSVLSLSCLVLVLCMSVRWDGCVVACGLGRGSQTLNPGWARKQHFLNFFSFSWIFSHLSSIFLHFLPPGKALATPLDLGLVGGVIWGRGGGEVGMCV